MKYEDHEGKITMGEEGWKSYGEAKRRSGPTINIECCNCEEVADQDLIRKSDNMITFRCVECGFLNLRRRNG